MVSTNDFVVWMFLQVTVPYSMLARAIIFTCDGLHSLAGCGVGGGFGGCGGGNQITHQIESHHLSIRPSVRPSVRSAKFALHLPLFANGHGTHSGGDLLCKQAGCFFRSVARGMKSSKIATRDVECPSSVRPQFSSQFRSPPSKESTSKQSSLAHPTARCGTDGGQIDRVLADESKLRRCRTPFRFSWYFYKQACKSMPRVTTSSCMCICSITSSVSDSVESHVFTNVSNHAAVIFPSLLSWQAARYSLTSEVERACLMKHTLSHKFHALCSLGAAKTRKGPTSLPPSFPSQDNDQAS